MSTNHFTRKSAVMRATNVIIVHALTLTGAGVNTIVVTVMLSLCSILEAY